MTRERANNDLFQAILTGNISAAKEAIRVGASPNARDAEGDWTALHWAADGGHLEIVQLLINAGADVDSRDKANHTAEYRAELNSRGDVADMLNAARAARPQHEGHASRVIKSRNTGEPQISG